MPIRLLSRADIWWRRVVDLRKGVVCPPIVGCAPQNIMRIKPCLNLTSTLHICRMSKSTTWVDINETLYYLMMMCSSEFQGERMVSGDSTSQGSGTSHPTISNYKRRETQYRNPGNEANTPISNQSNSKITPIHATMRQQCKIPDKSPRP
jgi:hypothetical protein